MSPIYDNVCAKMIQVEQFKRRHTRYSHLDSHGYSTRGEISQPRVKLRDHNAIFYRVLLEIVFRFLIQISCDSRDSRQDSKDSGRIRRFQRDSWSCRHDSESCRTPWAIAIDCAKGLAWCYPVRRHR